MEDELRASAHAEEDEEDFNPKTLNSIAPMVDDPEGDPDFKSAKKVKKTKVTFFSAVDTRLCDNLYPFLSLFFPDKGSTWATPEGCRGQGQGKGQAAAQGTRGKKEIGQDCETEQT